MPQPSPPRPMQVRRIVPPVLGQVAAVRADHRPGDRLAKLLGAVDCGHP